MSWVSRFGKRIAARALGAALGLLGRRGRGGPLRRVLVIRVDQRVGNVLLTTPLIRALETARPALDVDVLVAVSKESILEGVARTIPFDKKLIWRQPLRLFGSLMQLRRRRYDAVIDASHWHTFSVTSAALMAWSGAPIRIGHDRGAIRRFATDVVGAPTSAEWEIRTKLRLLEPLGLSVEVERMHTRLGEGAARMKMRAWLEAQGLTDPVGLAPGGRKLDHRAPGELYSTLGRIARDRGRSVIVLWGPGEERLAEEVAEGAGGVVAPCTDLDELAALMRECAAVVANDTGPMHLAVACDVPTVALFRGGEPARWGHSALGHEVIELDRMTGSEARIAAQKALEKVLGVERPA